MPINTNSIGILISIYGVLRSRSRVWLAQPVVCKGYSCLGYNMLAGTRNLLQLVATVANRTHNPVFLSRSRTLLAQLVVTLGTSCRVALAALEVWMALYNMFGVLYWV